MLLSLVSVLLAEVGAEVILHKYAKSASRFYLGLGVLLYVVLALLFAHAMRSSTLTSFNTAWQCANVVLVSVVGIFLLGERVSRSQAIGVVLAAVAMVLMFF